MSDSKKSLERCALDAFLKNNRALRTYTVYEDERPDFLLVHNEHDPVNENHQ